MEYTELGKTGIHVSKICFGTWAYGGDWGNIDTTAAKAAIRKALDLGVNFFDTAQAYGFGASERLLGEALQPEIRGRRSEIFLATKGGLRQDGDGMSRDSSRSWIRQGVEDSLRFLGTDYVDFYQIHWPDPKTPFEETAATLDELVREGKIRFVGVSNYDDTQMRAFEQVRKLDVLQPPYHLFRRDIEEKILSYCQEHGIGVLAYGPLAHGLLAGKYTTETTFPADDWRSKSDLFKGEKFKKNLGVVEELKHFASARGYTVAQLAIAWVLANPAVDVAIVGARNPGQIEGTTPAASIQLSRDDLREIERIMRGAVPVGGPTPEG